MLHRSTSNAKLEIANTHPIKAQSNADTAVAEVDEEKCDMKVGAEGA